MGRQSNPARDWIPTEVFLPPQRCSTYTRKQHQEYVSLWDQGKLIDILVTGRFGRSLSEKSVSVCTFEISDGFVQHFHSAAVPFVYDVKKQPLVRHVIIALVWRWHWANAFALIVVDTDDHSNIFPSTHFPSDRGDDKV